MGTRRMPRKRLRRRGSCRDCGSDGLLYRDTGRCQPCYNKECAVKNADLFRTRRLLATELLGGRCVECGSTDDLRFHRPGLGAIFRSLVAWNRKMPVFVKSLQDIKLLCKMCYRSKKVL